MAQNLGWLVIHRDAARRMAQFAPPGQQRVPRKQGRQDHLVAMQHETGLGYSHGRINKTGNNSCRPGIAAHSINRYYDPRGSRGRQRIRCLWHCGVLKRRGLRRVLVQIDLFRHGNNFARIIMATSAAHMVWTLQLAAIWAIGGISGNQRVMCAAHIALGFGDSVLWNSHVSTSGSGDMPLILLAFFAMVPDGSQRNITLSMRRGT